MSTNPKAQIAANVGTVVGAAVSVTAAAVAASVAIGPLSGQGLTKKGVQNLKDAENFLHKRHTEGKNKEEYIVPAPVRAAFQQSRLDALIRERDHLKEATRTIKGSLANIRTGRKFYYDTKAVREAAEELSDNSMTDHRAAEANLSTAEEGINFKNQIPDRRHGGNHHDLRGQERGAEVTESSGDQVRPPPNAVIRGGRGDDGGSRAGPAPSWHAQAYPPRTSKGRSSTMDTGDTHYYSMMSEDCQS